MSKLITTLCSGENYINMEDVFKERMKNYALKCGADFEIMYDNSHEHPAYNKLELKKYSYYDRILYLDADIIIRNDAPDLFNIVPEDKLGIFDESYLDITPNILRNTIQFYNSFMHTSHKLNEYSDDTSYYNTGVMLFNKDNLQILDNNLYEHEDYYADQGYINYQIKLKNIKVFDIGFKFNGLTTHKCYGENGKDRIRNTYFIHFNGANTFKDKSECIKDQMKYINEVESELDII